ncbi:branched-chain amino acid ABC transporter substrate-binding protein [Agromyces archimandritae]|uniref:Branched-chain amino acid ABC transporter substrate-binding protein n=1 Tax=Agromyces archimandritae TaxID=2781962 RepID=A0A975IQY9_9MICO|nr:branched-chain amino acid ABC transporter substrate-binding protein [Agromyces archimandritae]QTX05541.1 branched-chain amino acid ABC transporter substrate-binding protein [Agromyces archimandritae]
MSFTPNRRRPLAPAAALAAAAALLLAGCSGGIAGGDEGGDGDASGPIKLGMLAPFSGSESAFGDYMKNGAQMAVDEINEDGGVDGRELELVVEDDACDATASVAAANKLVAAGVEASVGGYCSGATLPVLPIFDEAGVPMVIPAANSNALVEAGLDTVFLINGTGTQQAQATLEYALKVGATRVAVLNDNTDYSKDLADSFVEQAEEEGTIEIVLDQSVTPGEKDYSANVKNVIGSTPDFVVWTGYYQEGALITRQLIDAGYAGPILVGDGSVDKKFAEIAGAGYTENVVGTFTQTPDMLKGAEEWIASYEEAFGEAPGPYSTQSYDAVRVVAEAMKNAGSTETDAVVEGLRGLDGFPVFSGPLTFTDEGTLSSGGFAIVSISEDGTFVLKDDLQD